MKGFAQKAHHTQNYSTFLETEDIFKIHKNNKLIKLQESLIYHFFLGYVFYSECRVNT